MKKKIHESFSFNKEDYVFNEFVINKNNVDCP